MVATVEELLKNSQEPVTITMDSPVAEALQLIVDHDFSQLPIVDEAGKQLGIVTAEGILKSQRNFGASLDQLKVQHASATAALALPGDDVFDVFNQFEQNSAVLIVDNQNNLLGIITPWDTAAYLQRRAEDIMLVEDVEVMLKDHILAAYTNDLNEDTLNKAISRMVDRSEDNYKTIESALKQYINRNQLSHKPEREKIEESFADAIFSAGDKKSFDDLTFYQFMELLLHKDIWDEYGKLFMLEAEHVRNLLNDVRKVRNKLAHFRGELTEKERKKVRFCRDWLQRFPPKDFIETEPDHSTKQSDLFELNPTVEEIAPNESRYAKLAIYLHSLKIAKETFSFEQIEEILEGELPPSAWDHRSWWANDSVGHVQSKQWLDADWRVASINMSEHRVTFARIEEREKMYIGFFSKLLEALRKTDFPLRDVNPTGTSWIHVNTLPRDRSGQYALFAFAFARGKRFRVELYIDALDQEKNHEIFDILANQKLKIETELGQELSWEKLEDKRACRIALYHDGSITDSENELNELSEWATTMMLRLEYTLSERTSAALKEVL